MKIKEDEIIFGRLILAKVTTYQESIKEEVETLNQKA